MLVTNMTPTHFTQRSTEGKQRRRKAGGNLLYMAFLLCDPGCAASRNRTEMRYARPEKKWRRKHKKGGRLREDGMFICVIAASHLYPEPEPPQIRKFYRCYAVVSS
ncbi:unnamed protein product [Ectocarpus sp. 12 AP-2014]